MHICQNDTHKIQQIFDKLLKKKDLKHKTVVSSAYTEVRLFYAPIFLSIN